jgi:hypothetical protein
LKLPERKRIPAAHDVLSLVAFHQLLKCGTTCSGHHSKTLPKPIITAFYGNVFFFNNCSFETTVNKSRITPPKINTIAMGIGSLAQFDFVK